MDLFCDYLDYWDYFVTSTTDQVACGELFWLEASAGRHLVALSERRTDSGGCRSSYAASHGFQDGVLERSLVGPTWIQIEPLACSTRFQLSVCLEACLKLPVHQVVWLE